MQFNIEKILDKFGSRARLAALCILVTALVIVPLTNAYYGSRNEKLREELKAAAEKERAAADIAAINFEKEKCKTCLQENKELMLHVVEVSSMFMDFKLLMLEKQKAQKEAAQRQVQIEKIIATSSSESDTLVYAPAPVHVEVTDEAMDELDALQWRIMDSIISKTQKLKKEVEIKQ